MKQYQMSMLFVAKCSWHLYFQIHTNLSDLRGESSRLQSLWQTQSDLFNQKLQYQMFLQEVDSLEAMCATHEVCMYLHYIFRLHCHGN